MVLRLDRFSSTDVALVLANSGPSRLHILRRLTRFMVWNTLYDLVDVVKAAPRIT